MTQRNRHGSDARELLDYKLMRAIFFGLICIVCLVAAHQVSKTDDVRPPGADIAQETAVFIVSNPREGTVLKTARHEVIVEFAPGDGGVFEMLGTVIKRQRARHNADPDIPIMIRLHNTQKVTLFDPAIDQTYNLSSYGRDNVDQIVEHLIRQKPYQLSTDHGGPDGTPKF
ncbi:MAG: photosynthetic complex assembly protein PuhC [Pseudomonadota bacterium]